ncbi:hypothetical protein EMPS_04337 [Entomortierella parvispora]|uniref:F-box domain-containing protein n=1 Tax=Entomortierella parvispora TaxID=205924 RepID=A0A9P3LVQ2_9FUNG|nr:hypothetical protein EMPS_04337 [Entomortierella parvispora]
MIYLEDLPLEIVHAIISQCSPHDLTVAARVCRQWLSIMQPIIWEKVVINDPATFHRFKDGNRKAAAIARNGHLIRHLRTRYLGILDDLLVTPNKKTRSKSPGSSVASIIPTTPRAACVNLECLFVDSEPDPELPAVNPFSWHQREIQKPISPSPPTMPLAVAFGGQLPAVSVASTTTAFPTGTMAAASTAPVALSLGEQSPDPSSSITGAFQSNSGTTSTSTAAPIGGQQPVLFSTFVGASLANSMEATTPTWTNAPFAGQLPDPSSVSFGAFQESTMAATIPAAAPLSAITNPPRDLSLLRREIHVPPPPTPIDPTNLSILLCSNPGLKMLTLNGRAVDEDHVLSQVIQDLPSDIEFLSIKGTMDQFQLTTTDTSDSPEDAPDEQMNRFNKLQEIRLGGDKINNQIIARLIQQSPVVETFRLITKTTINSHDMASLFRKYCYNLKELYLDNYYETGPESDVALANYLSMSTKGWITIGIPGVPVGPLSVSALLKHYSTLENLKIQGCSGISSANIQQILTTAANLKQFRALTPHRSPHSSDLALDAEDLIRSSWVCLGLESFRCVITGVPRPDIKHKMNGRPLTGRLHEFSLQDSYHVHRQVYEQLSALTRLKELRLGFSIWDSGWRENFYEDEENEGEYSEIGQRMAQDDRVFRPYTPRHLELGRQYECLALTLESGLDILRTLTELEVIDFRRMQIGYWRESEQLWAREHWKKLGAPYQKFPFVDRDYEDPFWKPLDELDEMTREDEHTHPELEEDIMHLYVPPVLVAS